MIESLIMLIIALVILYVVYLVVTWLLGQFPVPGIVATILNIVIGAIAVIVVLRFLAVFLSPYW